MYKKRRRRRHSARSEASTNSASKKKKKKKGFSKFLRRTLLIAMSAVGAYLVYSIIEAENIGGLLEDLIAITRGAL